MTKDQERYEVLRTRRDFLKYAACGAMSTAGLTNTISKLRLINAAMAQVDPGDYKALVCIFLNGGNDANNLIIPTDSTEWTAYSSPRGLLAIPLTGTGAALPISPLVTSGHSYGFHPTCSKLQTLFGQGKLATLFNVGSLSYPMTKTDYNGNVSRRPPQLYSHSDQQTQWQTGITDQPATTGWAGRCSDLLNVLNTANTVSMAVSLIGANTFEVGNVTQQYNVSTGGAVSLTLPGSTAQQNARKAALQSILDLNATASHLQVQAYSSVLSHAVNTGATLNSAITSVANGGSCPNTTFSALYGVNGYNGTYFKDQRFADGAAGTASNYYIGNPYGSYSGTAYTKTYFVNSLMQQLQMVARMIEAGYRSTANGGLGMRRQVFFVQVGGYDTHTAQVTSASGVAAGAQSNLLCEISEAMYQFYTALADANVAGGVLKDMVTSFTASDFGRTFQTNGQGSDHGWGSHHLVMGGAVDGQKTFGTWPTLALGGPDDTGTGRWIPTTSVDQYSAELASWFGISSSDLLNVFPNIGRFGSRPSFMKTHTA